MRTVGESAGTFQSADDFESLIAALSSRFIGVAASDVDGEIDDVLCRICAWADADFVVLWQWSDESPDTIVPTHHHHVDAGWQLPERMSDEQFPWCRQQMLGGQIVAIASLDEFPAKAAIDREHCRRLGIRSNLTIPLMLGSERPLGALSVNIVRKEQRWPAAVVKQLKLVAQVLSTALARQRASEALRANEARLRAGAELAGLGFHETDYRSGVMYGDKFFWELVGIPGPMDYREVAQRWTERIHPEDRRAVLDVREKLHDGTLDRVASEYRYLHPTRGEIWIDHLAAAVDRDADGRLVRNIGVLRDIGAQKKVELELRSMGQRLLQAQEQERALIARELHDDLSQRLAVLAIDVARAEVAAADAALGQDLRSVREELVRVSEDVHTLAYQLHPSVLEELGLGEALRAECERLSRHRALELSLSVEYPADVRNDAALCLFRVAQEALGNAMRHGKARNALVRLRQEDGGLRLAIQDDGIGFDMRELEKRHHLGFTSMRERLRLVSGTLDIDSAPGSGTTVIAWIPLAGARA